MKNIEFAKLIAVYTTLLWLDFASLSSIPRAIPGKVMWSTNPMIWRCPALIKFPLASRDRRNFAVAAVIGPKAIARLHFLHQFQAITSPLVRASRTLIIMTASLLLPRRTLASPISALLAATAGLSALMIEVPAARADDLIVKYDQSQLLRLPRPAAEIIVGNPSIADVSVQGSNLLVITGKSFGITNIISLDADRNIIQDQRVLVQRDEARVVNLQKGPKRESYNCSPQCNPSITIGDDIAYFDNVTKATSSKMKTSETGAEGSGSNGQ